MFIHDYPMEGWYPPNTEELYKGFEPWKTTLPYKRRLIDEVQDIYHKAKYQVYDNMFSEIVEEVKTAARDGKSRLSKLLPDNQYTYDGVKRIAALFGKEGFSVNFSINERERSYQLDIMW